MTTEEWIERQRKRAKELESKNKPLAVAAASTHSTHVTRIFVKGKNAFDRRIGSYDNKNELYVHPRNSPRAIPLRGKRGKSKKRHVTGYFRSYKSFRQQIGRQTAFVDLVLSGQLRSDYARPPKRINAHKYIALVARSHNADKMDGAEKKYGFIFQLTTRERRLFMKIIKEERLRIGI